MSIVCGDLLELGYFKKMKLVAGRGGLNRRLTWPYVGQTTTVSQWVHGGELLFITGIGRDNSTDSLETLVSECVSKGLCGLVLLVGSEYIREIPPSIVLQADSCGLPLFEMPWDIKLIDVTSEIVDLIMLDKYERRKTDSFLNRLLFPQAGETATVSELAEAYRVKLNPFCFIAVFHILLQSDAVSDYTRVDSLEVKLQETLDSLCRQKGVPFVSMASGGNIICFLTAATEEDSLRAAEYLRSAHRLVCQIYPDEEIILSFGRTYSDAIPMSVSYKEACKALELYRKLNMEDNIVSYSQLGIYRLLLKIENPEEIRQYYQYRLDKLLRHDRETQADLIPTLHQYLRNDCNLVKTSQALFIHRNTLVYRLNKIRELTGHDLDDAQGRLELFNSIIAKEFLGD